MFHFLFILILSSLTGFGQAIPLQSIIRDAANRNHLDPNLVKAVIQVESNFKEKALSSQGAMGLMQVMPRTAQDQGIRQPYHVGENVMGACQYLRELLNRYRGNLKLALAAYNAGPHRVDQYKGIPPYRETQQSVHKVIELYHRFRSEHSK